MESELIQSSYAAQPTPLAATPATEETYRFGFHGQGGPFFFLLLKNVLLTMITVGIYAPWAKAERRKFLWSNVEIHGQRLVFTGTGYEIFIAYLKLAACYAVAFGVLTLAEKFSAGVRVGALLLVGIPALILVPYAIYWSRAYLLSRTQWRGIRFGLVAGAGPYARTFVGGYLLTIITLGIYGPFWANNLRRVMTNNTRLGSEPFHYDGVGKEVFWIMLKGMLLSLITLGIYLFWMHAALQRYYLQHTTFNGARGDFQVTGGTFFGLNLLNVLGTTLTLGLAFPWISVHMIRTILAGVSFKGQIDFARISQNAAVTGAGGDVLANALDVGLGI